MSVVIAAPQVKPIAPAPANSADAGSTAETTAPGADFASLLLGQLAAGADLLPAVPESPAVPIDSNSVLTEPTPQDAASMLAALGALPPEQVPKAATPLPPAKAETSGIVETPLTPLANTSPLNARDAQDARNESKVRDFELSALSGSENKPAKLAVADFVLPKGEALSAANLAEEARTNGAAGMAPSAQQPPPARDGILKIETPVRDHAWAGDFSQKIVWLASNDKQFAQLTLNPPQMGPIEISLNLNKDGASALFVSQNADVREAIETALPRLREMFASAGIELGQANVSAESFRHQGGNEEARQGAPRWMADNAILGGDSVRGLSGQAIMIQRGNGMVDTFA